MKILIFGATGFIGSNLVSFFKKKKIKVIFVRKFYNKKNIFHKNNQIYLIKNIKKSQVIINCVGTGIINLDGKNINHKKSNILFVNKLVETFLKHNIKKKLIIHLSSQAVYDKSSKLKKNEKSKINPQNYYGKSKLISELNIKKLSNFNKVIILRLFSVYGINNKKQIFWDACNKFRKNNFKFRGNGNEVRDFLYIDDLSLLISNICKIKINNNFCIYNVGSGKGTKIYYLLSLLKKKLNIKKRLIFENKKKYTDHFVSSNLKVTKDFTWQPKFSLEEGINKYLKWYKSVISKKIKH